MQQHFVAAIVATTSLIVACASEKGTAPPAPPSRAQIEKPQPPVKAASEHVPQVADPTPASDAGTPEEPPPQPPQPPPSACPAEMVHVKGNYCPDVEQTCADWMEAPTPGGVGRCRRFEKSVCKSSSRVAMEFCIDRDEYAEPGGLPMGLTSWRQAEELCQKQGKRLCKETEWNFACEGEDMLPYPIGLERDAKKCNYDQMKLLDPWGKVVDHRKPASALPDCSSPFGVRNMTGNVDEWTFRDVTNGKWRSALKGGWWMAARNRCRPATTAHDEIYRDFQTGFRCCQSP